MTGALPRVLDRATRNLATRPANNLASLDLLRSLAILLVLTGHLGAYFPKTLRLQHLPFVNFGWTGVDLFFVLSGFLIGKQLWKELRSSGTIRIRKFILRRGMRIWPLYFAFIALSLLHSCFSGSWHKAIWSDIFCVSNYFPGRVAGGWSLSSEEQFYIIVHLVLCLLAYLLKGRRLWVLPVLWLLALPLVRWLTLAHAHAATAKAVTDLTYAPLHTHSDGLAVGLLLAWFAVAQSDRWRQIRWPLGLAVLAGCCALAAVLEHFSNRLFAFSALALCYGAVTLLSLRWPLISRLSQWQGFYVLSRLSYGTYLNHLLIVPLVAVALQPFVGHSSSAFVLCWCASVAACSAAAFFGFAFIELPFLDLRDRKMRRAAPQRVRESAPLENLEPLTTSTR